MPSLPLHIPPLRRLEHAPEVRQVWQVRWRERAWAGLQLWEKAERLGQACGAEPGGPRVGGAGCNTGVPGLEPKCRARVRDLDHGCSARVRDLGTAWVRTVLADRAALGLASITPL